LLDGSAIGRGGAAAFGRAEPRNRARAAMAAPVAQPQRLSLRLTLAGRRWPRSVIIGGFRMSIRFRSKCSERERWRLTVMARAG